jgi:hypothetical protein
MNFYWAAGINATLRFGELVDGEPQRGCYMMPNTGTTDAVRGAASGSTTNLLYYDSNFMVILDGQRENLGGGYDFYSDCNRLIYERLYAIWSSTQQIYYNGEGGDIFDYMFVGGRYSIEFWGTPGTLDNYFAHHVQESALRLYQTSCTVSGFRGGYNNQDAKIGNTYELTLLNSEIDPSLLNHEGTSCVTYITYSVDYRFVNTSGTNQQNVNVLWWDDDNTNTFDLDSAADGTITQQLVEADRWTGIGVPPTATATENPYTFKFIKYGYQYQAGQITIGSQVDSTVVMVVDPVITVTNPATVAAYTGITVNHSTQTITISVNHTLNEIYDYLQYDFTQRSTADLRTAIIPFRSVDGQNFVCDYDFIVNTDITVTANNQTLVISTGSEWTLTGTAIFTGVLTDDNSSMVPIKVTGLINGSRARITRTDTQAELYKNQSGTSITLYFEHTGTDLPIKIRIRSVTIGNTPYLPWETTGTVTVGGYTVTVNQIEDTIFNYATGLLDQLQYRWRNDDQDEDQATWKANEDIDITGQAKVTNVRLRILVDEARDLPVSITPRLEVRKVGDPSWEMVEL